MNNLTEFKISSQNLNQSLCNFEINNLESISLKIAVEVFYVFGGFLSTFGIFLNFLCVIVVSKSTLFNKTGFGFYLKSICIVDIFKLMTEYQIRIGIMILHSFLNLNKDQTQNQNYTRTNIKQDLILNQDGIQFECKNNYFYTFLHCNLRLGLIMISENLSYIFSILFAADRCFRIWSPVWTKNHITCKRVQIIIAISTLIVFIYCHPHFYLIKEHVYINFPNGYFTNQVYSECSVKKNYPEYLSFNNYWHNVESVVNSIVLPLLMIFFNVLLAIGVLCKTKNKKSYTTNCTIKNSRIKLKKRKRLAQMGNEASLVVMIESILFIATVEPVNAFTYMYRNRDIEKRMQMQIYGITISLLNHSLNGVVYFICSQTFREDFKLLLQKFVPKKKYFALIKLKTKTKKIYSEEKIYSSLNEKNSIRI